MPDTAPRNKLQTRRLILGLAIVPLLPGFYSTLLFGHPWAFPMGLLLSYPTAVLVGLPLIFAFSRRNWLAWWQLCIAGALCVLPLEFLYWYEQTPPHLEAFTPGNALLLEGWGLFAGLGFWLLAIAGTGPVSWRELLGSWR